ncbi:MAG: hypothetical protein ACLTXL_12585 [Clostridia bacterium]
MEGGIIYAKETGNYEGSIRKSPVAEDAYPGIDLVTGRRSRKSVSARPME